MDQHLAAEVVEGLCFQAKNMRFDEINDTDIRRPEKKTQTPLRGLGTVAFFFDSFVDRDGESI